MVEMFYVYSSHVVAMGYDQDKAEFHVLFAPSIKHPGGRTVVYSEVTPDQAQDILTAPSAGQAVRNNLRDSKPFRYL